MGFIEWHQKYVRRFSASNIHLVLLGKAMILMILGTFFIQYLVAYVAPLFLFGILGMLPCWLNTWTTAIKKKKLNYNYILLDTLGKFFLLLVLGMVFAPYLWGLRWGVLGVGFLLTLPAWKEIMT